MGKKQNLCIDRKGGEKTKAYIQLFIFQEDTMKG